MKYCLTLAKSKQPKGKRYDCLVAALKDPLIRAKFKLVEYIAAKLNSFLRGFQTDQPMVPFLFHILKDIVDTILQMYVLKDVRSKNDTLQKLLNLDVTDVNIRKKKTDIGVGAKLVVAEYKKHKNFNQNTLDRFYKDCGVFLSSIVKHILEKIPIRRQIVRCASSLDPTIISNKDAQESCKLKFSTLYEKLAQLQRIPASLADRANEEYKKFLDEVVPRHSQNFLDFNIKSERLGSFLHLLSPGNKNYDNLWLICQIIFILFHGPAHIERGFKNNKDFEKDNQGELSLVSLRVIHEHMATNSVDSFSIPFTQKMVKC